MVAGVAKQMGMLTVGVVTIPFYFEKKRKIIKAMGRASGERRVEKAILNALDSPLLYGNDIGRAKRKPAETEPTPPPVPEEPRKPTIIDKIRNYLLNLVKDDGDY